MTNSTIPFRTTCLYCNPDATGLFVCKPHQLEEDEAKAAAEPTGRTNTSHAKCYEQGAHDKSKAGRQGCRNFRDANVSGT